MTLTLKPKTPSDSKAKKVREVAEVVLDSSDLEVVWDERWDDVPTVEIPVDVVLPLLQKTRLTD
jgi:hypothetical protein